MSVRYINDRFLPDKAIDIMDEASSKVRLMGYQTAPETGKLKQEIRDAVQKKEEAVKAGDFVLAREAKERQQ